MEYAILCVEKWITISVMLFTAYTFVDAIFTVRGIYKGEDISCYLENMPSNLVSALLWPFAFIVASVFLATIGFAVVAAVLYMVATKVKELVKRK